jgi:2-dehydropantoate 2-reductase
VKIAVLGAGALGCVFGGYLAQFGNQVTLISRNRAHVNAIHQHGLRLEVDGRQHAVQVNAVASAQGLGAVDLVIVLVKSFHTEAAMASANGLLGADTVVLSLQNGLGHEAVLGSMVGPERVLAGKTYVGGGMLGAGLVAATTHAKHTIIGELNGVVSSRAKAIAEVFNEAGLLTRVSDNMMGVMWDKLLVNISTGALSTISRLPYGALYQVKEIELTAIAAVKEAMEVAVANGIKLSYSDPSEPWRHAAQGLPADFKTSMLQSVEKGSTTEIDFINGAVVRWGQRCGVATPVNATLVACIKGIEAAMTTPHSSQRSYVEHVAIRVRDIQWHIQFFYEALGMEVREIDGPAESPNQYWTIGGLQLMSTPGFEAAPSNDTGWLAHLGIMVEDLDAAIGAAAAFGAKALPQGPNWLQLPDGLAVELIQASPGTVAKVLAVNPRAS